ncbi:trans-sulfuration enzyme family protein [Kumtagia ephedrae]|nr:aminotransferase class V-fold PLP-dependent enzyme [Mesorhizobium ephedrae]
MPDFMQLNPPVHRASTVLFKDTDAFLARGSQLYDGFMYGLYGTPTTRELETRIAAIEGGHRAIVVPSGLAAITHVILALCKPGDHIIITDSAYGGSRAFATSALVRLGIDVEYIPSDAGSVQAYLKPQTRLVLLESPGYYTMEIQDIAAIAAEAHAAGALVLLDNSWGFGASSMFEHGVDICCTALSKYAAGAGDLCMGSITVATEDMYRTLKAFVAGLGAGVSSDDAYLVMRGLLTLDTRLRDHAARALGLSQWLSSHPAVKEVINPARPGDRWHARFQKYFRGGNGLFSVVLHDGSLDAIRRMLDGLEVFKIGASWGSPHSLLAAAYPHGERSVDRWPKDQYILRLHIGLEKVAALKCDLDRALSRAAGIAALRVR